jgi:hypothetical protein
MSARLRLLARSAEFTLSSGRAPLLAAMGDHQSFAAKQLVDFAQQHVVLVQLGSDPLGLRLQQLLRPADRNSYSGTAHALRDYLELTLVRHGSAARYPPCPRYARSAGRWVNDGENGGEIPENGWVKVGEKLTPQVVD